MNKINILATQEVAAVKETVNVGNEMTEETQVVVNQEEHSFSFFKKPITNGKPEGIVNIEDVYNYIKNNEQAAMATKQLRAVQDESVRSSFKRRNFDYVTFSGQFSYRNEKSLIKHSGLVCIDFDHLSEDAMTRAKEQLRNDVFFETLLLFVSPSGDGLKWVVPINTKIARHEEWFDAICKYLLKTYGLEADKACSDVSRTCFLPHDNEVIINGSYRTDFSVFNPYDYIERMDKRAVSKTELKVQSLIEELKKRGIDITEDYNEWIIIGFALVSEFGEDGRKYYHQLSNNYSKYTFCEVQKKYDELLKSYKGGVTIGTLFHIAKRVGINISEVDDNTETDYMKYIISANETFDDADYILECEDVKFFSKGNISFIKAKEKAGKSLSITVMIGALLKGELFKLKAVNKETKILVADTEQTRKNTVERYKMALKLGGYDDDTPLLKVLSLREENYKTRKKIIFDAIAKEKPDIVFIDGLVDLILDFNNVEQSQQIIQQLMSEATKNNCCIVSVIHTNPNDDKGKMRGHFGTMAAHKAGEVLKCSKCNGIFTVTTDCSREEEPPSWSFRFDNDGNIVDGEEHVETKEELVTRLVIEFITDKGGTAKLADLQKMAEANGMKRSTAYKYLEMIKGNFCVNSEKVWSLPS